jgi:hypothetical protein
MGVSGHRHAPAALYPRGKDPGTCWIGGWVGLRAGLDTEARGKILYLCRGWNPSRPVCSETILTALPQLLFLTFISTVSMGNQGLHNLHNSYSLQLNA